MICAKHNMPMKELFTSQYCEACDQESLPYADEGDAALYKFFCDEMERLLNTAPFIHRNHTHAQPKD